MASQDWVKQLEKAVGEIPGARGGMPKSNPQLQLLMNGSVSDDQRACFNCKSPLRLGQDVCTVCWAGQTDENPSRRKNAGLSDADCRSLNEGFKKFHGVDGSAKKTWQCPGNKNYKLWLCGRSPGVSWAHANGDTCSACRDQSIVVEKHAHEFVGHRITFTGESRPYLCVDLEARQLVLLKGDLGKLRAQEDDQDELGTAPLVEYVATVPRSTKGPYHYIHATKKGFEPTLQFDRDLDGYRYTGGVYSVEDWLHD